VTESLCSTPLLNACDARDGLKDGMIFDPLGCKFDPEVLRCNLDIAKGIVVFHLSRLRDQEGVRPAPRTQRETRSIRDFSTTQA